MHNLEESSLVMVNEKNGHIICTIKRTSSLYCRYLARYAHSLLRAPRYPRTSLSSLLTLAFPLAFTFGSVRTHYNYHSAFRMFSRITNDDQLAFAAITTITAAARVAVNVYNLFGHDLLRLAFRRFGYCPWNDFDALSRRFPRAPFCALATSSAR